MTVQRARKAWSMHDEAVLTAMVRQTRKITEIAEALGRTVSSVQTKITDFISKEDRDRLYGRFGAGTGRPGGVSIPRWEKSDLIAMDRRFKLAMVKAIAAGLEYATVGVRVETGPMDIRALRFQPGPTNSCCGSMAAMCVEAAGGDRANTFA